MEYTMARFGFNLKILELFLILHFFIKVSSLSYKRMTYEPTFLNTPRHVTVHKNDLARLQCRIKHLGPKQVSWRKVSMDYPLTVGTVRFDPKEDISVSFKDLNDQMEALTQWDLIIKRAQPRHSGMYECQISAKNLYTHYVNLKVLDEALIVRPAISMFGTAIVNLHAPIKLVCNATGGDRPPQQIDWFFEGHMIRARDSKWNNRLHIFDHVPEVPGRMLVSELTIDYSEFNDKGKYVCRSFAEDDFYTTSIDVSVLNTEKDVDKREEKNYRLSYSTTIENASSRSSSIYFTKSMLWFVIVFVLKLKISSYP